MKYELTIKEYEVCELVSQGLQNKMIADMMKISVRTVESHISNALSKCNFKSRSAIIFEFVKNKQNFKIQDNSPKAKHILKLSNQGEAPELIALVVNVPINYVEKIIRFMSKEKALQAHPQV